MSTRTAIFKEQENGTFKGIYCHHDGYLEGVGYTLLKHYQDPEKTQKLIDQKRVLSSLGENTEVKLSCNEKGEWLSDRDSEYYCTAVRFEYEQFIAEKLNELQMLDYLTVNENDEIQGFTQKDTDDNEVFTPFRGSDNNGYVYVQMLDGQWLVSIYQGSVAKSVEYFRTYNENKFTGNITAWKSYNETVPENYKIKYSTHNKYSGGVELLVT